MVEGLGLRIDTANRSFLSTIDSQLLTLIHSASTMAVLSPEPSLLCRVLLT